MIDDVKDQLRGFAGGLRLSVPVVVSTVALGLSTYVLAKGLGEVAGSLFARSVDETSADPLAALAKDSNDFLEQSRKRFDGRSIYSLPPAPVRKPVVTERPKPVEPPKDPGPPPPPAVYSGPSPTSVFGDIVNFGQLRVKLGETTDGIKVTAIQAPYSITVEHMRGTYTVPLFGRPDDRLLKPTSVSGMSSGIRPGGEGSADGKPAGDGRAVPAPGGAAAAADHGSHSPGAANGAAGAAANGRRPGAVSGPGGAANRQPPAHAPAGPNGLNSQPTRRIPAGASSPNPTSPSEVPSPAMEPQEIPAPGSQGEEPPSPATPGIEYVDRAMLPERLSDERIASMSREQAQAALGHIEAVSGLQIDPQSRARLSHERELLARRIRSTPN